MEKLSIKKYQDEQMFWNDIAAETVVGLSAAIARRKKERVDAGIEVTEKSVGLAFLGLSGGKTPAPLYRLLAEDKAVDWAKTEVFLLDERLVPREDERSNSRMIRENLYAGPNEVNLAFFHDFMTELPVDETTQQYREEFLLVPEEQLDVVILGVGPDGHFAAIFPGYLEKSRESYNEGEMTILSQTEAFDVRGRISLTAEIIQKACKILIVMKGKDKLAVLEEMENGSKSAEEFPIKFLMEGTAGNVQIFYCQ